MSYTSASSTNPTSLSQRSSSYANAFQIPEPPALAILYVIHSVTSRWMNALFISSKRLDFGFLGPFKTASHAYLTDAQGLSIVAPCTG